MNEEIHATMVLTYLRCIGPLLFAELLKGFGDAATAVRSIGNDWREIRGFTAEMVSALIAELPAVQRAVEEDQVTMHKHGIRACTAATPDYPAMLREINSAPPIIYVWGEDVGAERPTVAIVGSRRCTYYGEKLAKKISAELAECGVTTVSGLARGIDSAVHVSTMDHGGRTWAVLGCGLGVFYPPENEGIFNRIRASGAVISEFPLTTKPLPANFPRRNRIIAGSSHLTVVIEGTEKSGALITARLAADAGRDVLAVPGPVSSPMSAGPHALIRDGAKIVTRTEDILEELPAQFGLAAARSASSSEKVVDAGMPPVQQSILRFITADPMHKETLAFKMSMDPYALGGALLDMELRGIIKTLPGGFLVRG